MPRVLKNRRMFGAGIPVAGHKSMLMGISVLASSAATA